MYFSVVTLVLATFFLACSVHGVRRLRNIRSLQESQTNNLNSLSSDLVGKSDVRNTGDTDIATRKKIADLAEKLPSDRLLEDPVLVQTIDRINQITTYSLPYQENPDVIFQRVESDNLKEVVVLSANEDHLYQPNKNHKNVYAVLRRVPNAANSKPVYYFLFYAYLRPSKPEDDDAVIDVGGKRFTVEWDTWDDRSKKSGWLTCDSTIFFSCEMEKYSLNGSTNTEIENINFNAEKQKQLTKIKAGTNEAYDLNLYYGLFGEFDEFSSSAAQGRSMNNQGRSLVEGAGKVVCSAFSIFMKPKCDKDGNRAKNLKHTKNGDAKNGDLLDFLAGQLNTLPPSANQLWPQKMNNVLIPIYGSLYHGYPKNPAIFIPANKGMPSIFIADVDDSSNPRLIYGDLFAPSLSTGPMAFRPQDKQMLKGVYNIKGTFIPDGLTDAGLNGGIHGSLSERPNSGVFVTDVAPRMIYLDPKLTDPKTIFFNPALMNGPDGISDTALPTTNQGPISGTIYDTVQGGTRIFIPEGEGIPGYFLPSDPTHPAFGNAPHGDFYPDKSGTASFFPDSKGALVRYRTVPGAFGPDNMDEPVFIFGKMSYAASGGVFIPSYPGRAYSYVKDSPDVRSVWAPFSTKTDVTTQAPSTIKSKKPEHYGVYFQGIPPIFFPQGKELAGSLIPSDNRKSIKGTFYPAQPGYPALFDPDPDEVITALTYKNIKAKFLPEALVSKSRSSTHKGISGVFLLGNRGKNNSFYPDVPSVPWHYDPDHPDEGVWSPTLEPVTTTTPPTNILADLSGGNKLKGNALKGKLPEFIRGQYFKGNSEGYGMFIPDDFPEVLGTIIPDSNMYPQLHGSFSTAKSTDSPMITLETPMQVAKASTFAGKFFPDGLKHPSQGVKGIFTTLPTSLTEIAFRPDIPSKVFLYKPNIPENSKVWAPNIPGVTAEENSLVTTETTTKSEDTAASNDQGVFGVLYPGIGGSKGVFLPDEQEVSGTILFDSTTYTNMHGKIIAGKYGNPPLFYPDDPAEGSTLFNVAGAFMADWMPTTSSNQGIRGRVTAGDADNCVFRTDVVGKAYWYIKGRLETQKIWSPLTLQNTSQEFRIQNGPTEATANMKTFVEGSYFQGDAGVPPVFIPNDGTPGYITPLINPNAKTAGVLYPEEPPNFVPDNFIYIPNGTAVQFLSTPSQDNPSESVERFTGTFIQGTIIEPPIILPSLGVMHGWSNVIVNKNESTMTHNYTFVDNKWVNSLVPKPETIMKNGIAVGGGYRGYETGGYGFEGVMDATSPIFKEFLEKRTSKLNRETGKNFEVPQNVILIDSSKQKQSFNLGTDATTIESSEYREWLSENYMIKRTRIKTATINEIVEIAVPIQAEKYITLKKTPKPWKINLKINSEAGAGSGAGGEGGGISKGSASGGVTGSIGNCKSFSTSANAVASARNGSRSNAQAHALNGGTANALSNSKDNSIANSKANVERGGLANAKANAQNGGNADAASNAYGGGKANAFSNSAQTDMNVKANAIADKTGAECDGGLPDEIVVESSAVANAIGGDGTAAASANTQVKIDMAGIVARLQNMMSSKSGQDDDDSERVLDINIDAFSNANSQSGGRSFNTGSTLKSKGAQVVLSGWKTGLDIITPNSTLAHEDTLFFGIGQCPFVKKTFRDLQRAEKPEEIVAFYLTLLRMDCSEAEKVRTLLLIVDGFLELDDKTLRIPDNHIYINESKLTSVEMQRFSRAFELSMFTRTVVLLGENLKSEGSKREAPDGSVISASVKFITEHILNCLIEISMSYSKHFVRLTRNSILTLRSILTKLYLDAKKLESCDQCSVDKNINRNDRIQINTLLQFIYHGLPPFTLDAQNIRKIYKSFFVTNVNAIKERLSK